MYTIILIMGTPKMAPLILGKPQIELRTRILTNHGSNTCYAAALAPKAEEPSFHNRKNLKSRRGEPPLKTASGEVALNTSKLSN